MGAGGGGGGDEGGEEEEGGWDWGFHGGVERGVVDWDGMG